jgi:hypothetical protein
MRATLVRDSIKAAAQPGGFNLYTQLTLAMQHVSDFYARGLFSDSARFNRLVNHVAIMVDYVLAKGVPLPSFNYAPPSTPYIIWHKYAGLGIYFQPVSTVQAVTNMVPRPDVPTDSVLGVAEAMYQYAVWHGSPLGPIPIWEYEFPWTSGGVSVVPPWKSGMAQGLALVLFTDAWQRSGDSRWKDRAFEVFRSMEVGWNEGGVRLDDTTHGYWWLEFHPTVMVWNGAAQALVGLTYFANATQDPAALHAEARGIEAMKYYTPEFDTGTWTMYSLTQGLNSRSYHHFQISLCDAMYDLTGDAWFKETADRWRSYVPPPGIS